MKGGQKKGLVVVHECCDNFYLTIKEEELIERLGKEILIICMAGNMSSA
jgi:hypothetical protein